MNPQSFLEALHGSHLDNGRMVYYAAKVGSGTKKPVMPATPFIFEYFIYNSIYQHDWIDSDARRDLVQHGEAARKRGGEGDQQRRLLDEFLLPACKKQPDLLWRAFAPFQHLIDLNGQWAKITPDANITAQQGKDFFAAVSAIQSIIQADPSSKSIDVFFDQLHICREFVGRVRNNIFHGRKKLDEIWIDGQRKRIELYHLLIQSINSLFFLTRGLTPVASDEVFHPIEITFAPKPIRLSSMEVLQLQVDRMIKKEDSELISWAHACLKPLSNQIDPSGALFYPSAGNDIITPVLIGLPFCTEFHFYDKGTASGLQKALTHLRKVLGISRDLKVTYDAKRCYEIEFEFAGIKRRIFQVKADNQEFLNTSSRLIFFFHRGDSMGEGGSDQPWESEWFARWKPMIPEGKICAILSDATPHGLAPELKELLGIPKKFSHSEHKRPYYCGIIHSSH